MSGDYVRYHYAYDDLMIAHLHVIMFDNYSSTYMFCAIDCN